MCLALIVSIYGFADELKVTGVAPTFKTDDPIGQMFIDDFNRELASAFGQTINELNGELNKNFAGLLNLDNLVQGFGTSSVFASHTATQRAYGGYKLLAVTLGSMVGLQLPGSPAEFLKEGFDFEALLNRKGGVTLGINPQVWNIHVGFNTSFLLKDLYLGARFGVMNLDGIKLNQDGTTLSFNNFTLGATANYQLMRSRSLVGLITWRGINVGTGLTFQNTNLNITMPLDEIRQDIANVGGPFTDMELVMDPRVAINIKVNTFTVPVEVITAIKIVFINIPFGLGFDIGFGTSELSAGMDADINAVNSTSSNLLSQDKPGSLSIGIGKEMNPELFNFKLMTGIGFTLGPVLIDIPLTYYVANNGFNVGMTIGVAF